MSKPYMQAGETYNRLTALESAAGSQDMILWRCDCGTEKRIRATQVRCGKTCSCGCFQREASAVRIQAYKSQMRMFSKHPLYNIWRGIQDRTGRPGNKAYKHYGGRGIGVCERWKDPETFYADIERLIGPRPGREFSIDRIDNDGNYEPGNVRWATAKEQMHNQRPRRRRSARVQIRSLKAEVAQLKEQVRALEAKLNANSG